MKYIKILYGIIFALLVYFTTYKSNIAEYFDYKFFDIGSTLVSNNAKQIDSSVIVVDIDEKSLRYLGQWPWSRLILAKLMENILSAKPTNIGMDIIFPERDKTSLIEISRFFKNYYSQEIKISGTNKQMYDNDKVFADAIKNAQVTMPVYMTNKISKKCYIPTKNRYKPQKIDTIYTSAYMLCNLDILQKNSSNIGFINAQEDKDGILRRVPAFIKYKNYYIPSFALANLMNIDNIKVSNNLISILGHDFKTDKNSNILLNFYDKQSYQHISAVDILSNNFDKKRLLGKFVLIGTTAVGLHDRYVATSGDIIPGIYVHATIIDNILHDSTIYQPKYLKSLNYIIAFFLSLALLILVYKKFYMSFILLFLGPTILYLILGIFLLKRHIYISIGSFLIPYFIFFLFVNIIFIFFYYKEKKIFLERLTNAHFETIDSMSLIAETRDAETGAHIIRTKEYMKSLADYLHEKNLYKNKLTKNYRNLIYRATPLHDIGKVGIPDAILKKPDKLDKDEYEIMKEHSEIGKNIIENAMKNDENNQFLQIAYNIAYYHHERWDGTGYPCGIKKTEIPLEARMMALADVYDALISKRCYKLSFGFKESEEIIIKGKGTHFDPTLVEAFIALKYKFREIATSIQ